MNKFNFIFVVFTLLVSFGDCSIVSSSLGRRLWIQNRLDFVKEKPASSFDRFLHHQMENNWAVLVAGSCGWGNYRHQADIAHAYQILVNHHFHRDKIILMMCDDVANDSLNPFPGKLFNNYSRIDVYEGIQIDYRGTQVSAVNFLKLMRGDQDLKRRGYKVLESKQDDHVFLFFTDHGSEGLIAFSNDELYAEDLRLLLHDLSDRKKFSQLVFYIEACESGSMFNYVVPNSVFATTAAMGSEPSYACFCDDDTIGTCLGDSYSVNWMNDTETVRITVQPQNSIQLSALHSLHERSLKDQFLAVKRATDKSHVQQFGDVHISGEDLDQFEGKDNSESDTDYGAKPNEIARPPPDQVDARMAHLVPHQWTLRHSSDPEARKRAETEIELYNLYEHHIDGLMTWIRKRAIMALSKNNNDQLVFGWFVQKNRRQRNAPEIERCYKIISQTFFDNCFRIQKYPMLARHMYKLKNLCMLQWSFDQYVQNVDLQKLIQDTCK
ncbi:hypothetical protein Ciccas_011021 [Cichlidogyrus casuarinus]|uniref:Hemoglobinase n=1 Tax=Cichlidogyrus casuarinus TaxID=1844966 RepID=A0ABD2PX55_9PLAT